MADRSSARKEYLKLVSAQDAEMPKNETLAEHRKHCKAQPGNCPFEKEADKVDEVESAQLNRPHGGVGQGKWRRGVPYQGSKSRIADSIISILPRGERFVDLFSGGGAVTHSAMLSGKYDSYRMNDIDGGAQDLFVDAVNGKYDNYEDPHYTAEQFAAIKGTPEAYMLSFNGLGRNLSKKSLDGRDRMAEQIRRVKELGGLKNEARKIEDSKNDYREVELKEGDVVYADIPYEATDTRGYSKGRCFDKEAFVKWAQEQNVPIYVSEYTMPKGWTEIADFDISGMRGGQRKEKLFVQSRFAENGKRRSSAYVTTEEDAAYADAVKRYVDALEEQRRDFARMDEIAYEWSKKTGKSPAFANIGNVRKSLGDEYADLNDKWNLVRANIFEQLESRYGEKIRTDAEYADAVKRGDRETALRMIREAAAKAMPNTKVVDKDGLPKVMYHGTLLLGDPFTKFSRKKGIFGNRNNPDFENMGFHFGDEKTANYRLDWLSEDMMVDGKRHVYALFLDIKNPLRIEDNFGSKFNIQADAIEEAARKAGDDNLADVVNALVRKYEFVNDSRRNEAKKFKSLEDAVRSAGYDGFVYSNDAESDDGADSYCAFESSQIKSTDITYDDEGNLIPLSKRFNFESVDIRDEAIEVEAQDEEIAMVVMSPWQVARAWAVENAGELESRIWRCAVKVPSEVKSAEWRKFGRELDADELVDMVGDEEFTREDMGEITPKDRAWWDKIEDAKVDIERAYFHGTDKDAIGKAELTKMLRQRPYKAVKMLVEALEGQEDSTLGKKNKVVEYLMIAEDSACHSKDPLHCRVHGIRSAESPLGQRGRVTLTATVGGVNSILETLTTSAPTFAGAVNNLRFRGANGRKGSIRDVWMKNLQVNGRALPKNVIIDGNDDTRNISLLERRIVSYLYGNPSDKAVGACGSGSVRDRVHYSQPEEREGAQGVPAPISGASYQGRRGDDIHGVSSAGIANPSTPSAPPTTGKLTQGEFAFDAWVDSGTGNMAWKPDKRKPRRRPVDKLPKKKVQEIIAENVKLIKTIPRFLHAEVGNKIYKLITDKITPDEFVNWCVDECDVSEGRAYLIAYDQVTKAKEQMKLADWRKQGIEFVMWKHRAGEKEPREYHIREWDGHSGIRNGKPNGLSGYVFHIDNPPVIDKKTGERGYPSALIGCKCYLKAIKTK